YAPFWLKANGKRDYHLHTNLSLLATIKISINNALFLASFILDDKTFLSPYLITLSINDW
ncbi:MAG: hypothetical protein RSC56_06500, partial [Acidaminococcaceae bacterium]